MLNSSRQIALTVALFFAVPAVSALASSRTMQPGLANPPGTSVSSTISWLLPALLSAGILSYAAKAYYDLRHQRLEWKERLYSDLLYSMATFHYRPGVPPERPDLRAPYQELEKKEKDLGRAWLQNIMLAKMDALWLYAPVEVIRACQRVSQVLDSDPNERVRAVGDLVRAMRRDLGVTAKGLPDFVPIYSRPNPKPLGPGQRASKV